MTLAATLGRWWRRPTAPLLAVAIVKFAVHLATNGVYGFQRDELYYIISGQHPALGYVDYPPVTPMLARLNTSIFGISPWTLRIFPALAGAAVVFLTGLCAREMGGVRGISTLASVLALLSPLLLGANWLFQTVTFDQLTWLIAIYLLLRIVRTGDRRLFVLLGVDLGIGLETKLTIVALCLGIAIAVVASRELRPLLRTRFPWIGLVIAIALAAPNLGWQVANGFPTLTYIENHSADIAQSGGVGMFVEDFLLFTGPLVLPVWVTGIVLLFRDRRLRPMGILTVIVIALLLPEGKAYYPAPTIPLVLAAGCVALGRIALGTSAAPADRRRGRRCRNRDGGVAPRRAPDRPAVVAARHGLGLAAHRLRRHRRLAAAGRPGRIGVRRAPAPSAARPRSLRTTTAKPAPSMSMARRRDCPRRSAPNSPSGSGSLPTSGRPRS